MTLEELLHIEQANRWQFELFSSRVVRECVRRG